MRVDSAGGNENVDEGWRGWAGRGSAWKGEKRRVEKSGNMRNEEMGSWKGRVV